MNLALTPKARTINQRVSERLVEHCAYQGNFVRTFSVQEITDRYGLRAEREAMAARLAAHRRTGANLAELNHTVDRTMRERRRVAAAIKAGDADRATAAKREHVEGVGRAVLRQLDGAVG